MIIVQCSICHKPKMIENRSYRKNKALFEVNTLAEFNKRYRCRKCRFKPYNSSVQAYLETTPEFKKLQHTLQDEVTLAAQRGITDPVVQKNFASNVKIILDSYAIIKYSFDIVNGELVGLMLRDIPFFRNIYIKLNSKGK